MFENIHEKVRIVISIQNIERNIITRYECGVWGLSMGLFMFAVTMTMDVAESKNFYIAGWIVSVLGFCLAGYFAVGAYRIKKKLGLVLGEMAQDKEGTNEILYEK